EHPVQAGPRGCSSSQSGVRAVEVLSPSSPRQRSAPDGSRSAEVEAEASELLRVALPVLGDLDVEVEVDLGPELAFDAAAGLRADRFESSPAGCDDDRLLSVTFDEEIDMDVPQRSVLAASLPRIHLLDLPCQGMRQFVANALQGRLADELGDHGLLRLI